MRFKFYLAGFATTLGLGAVSSIVACGDSGQDAGGAGGGAVTSTTQATSVATDAVTSTSSGGMGKAITSPCATNKDCAGGLCITENSEFGWATGYCSALCDATLAPCAEGDCVNIDNANVCLKKCDPATPADCTGTGRACVDLSGGLGDPANYCTGGCNAPADCEAANKCDLSQDPDHGTCIPKEICNNMVDDNNDGLVDCADPDCAADTTCTSGITTACAAPTALVVGTPATGTTADGTALFQGVCQGAFGAFPTGGGKEHVFSYTATNPGVLHLGATAIMGDLGLYVRKTCADGSTEVACSDNVFNDGDTETADVVVHAGDHLTIFVDAYSDMTEGNFSLTATFDAATCGNGVLEAPEQCDDHNVSNGDGCDMTCNVEIPYACSHAPTIALGMTSGTTTTGTNAFDAPVDNMNCTDGSGTNGNEVFYTYTPAATGMLTIVVTPIGMADFGLYARTDCTNTTTQIGCSDVGVQGDPETLTIPVTAATPVTIFVDAFESIGGPFTLNLTQN